MTLIECFDRSVNANIVSCLHLRPKKVIFLGDKKSMGKEIDLYRSFFKERNMTVQLMPEPVQMDRMDQIAETLLRIVRKEVPCVIDVTGGDERLLMAVGVLLAKLEPNLRKQVTIQKFDRETGLAQDCDGDGKVLQGHPADVTVNELIKLYYGRPYSTSPELGSSYRANDLDPLWDLSTKLIGQWNDLTGNLIYFESQNQDKTSPGNHVYLSPETLHQRSLNRADKLTAAKILLKKFQENGIVQGYVEDDYWDYRYTSPLFQYCVEKQGNLLEVKTLLEARDTLNNGRPYFYNHMMSVRIDWLKKVKKSETHTPPTNNEIDIILTRGLVPLFISCKNGTVDENELYKLNSVANAFGGPDAKKMLIATQLEITDNKSPDAFMRRAENMGIYLVPNAKELDKASWREAFIEAFHG